LAGGDTATWVTVKGVSSPEVYYVVCMRVRLRERDVSQTHWLEGFGEGALTYSRTHCSSVVAHRGLCR
jgi:hypothetical protein